MARAKAPRYGIAEWYGKDIRTLTPEQRMAYGQTACRHEDNAATANVPVCPFLATLIPGAKCNKAGGVCSMRKFRETPQGVTAVEGLPVVTMCPTRFLQSVGDDLSFFSWLSSKMLDLPAPIVVKETPFLRKVSDVDQPTGEVVAVEEETDDDSKKAGRIDWIIVNPATLTAAELDWCAIETQAVYFSGKEMRLDFDIYAAAPGPIIFPVVSRRPDYRSSGPKRLGPQLDVKVPVMRNWGKKVAVVVDRYFLENMNRLADPFPRARNDTERRDNADVVWFIVDYNEQLQLRPYRVTYTSLDSSRRALNATEPLSKSTFTDGLRAVIADPDMANKVFTV